MGRFDFLFRTRTMADQADSIAYMVRLERTFGAPWGIDFDAEWRVQAIVPGSPVDIWNHQHRNNGLHRLCVQPRDSLISVNAATGAKKQKVLEEALQITMQLFRPSNRARPSSAPSVHTRVNTVAGRPSTAMRQRPRETTEQPIDAKQDSVVVCDRNGNDDADATHDRLEQFSHISEEEPSDVASTDKGRETAVDRFRGVSDDSSLSLGGGSQTRKTTLESGDPQAQVETSQRVQSLQIPDSGQQSQYRVQSLQVPGSLYGQTSQYAVSSHHHAASSHQAQGRETGNSHALQIAEAPHMDYGHVDEDYGDSSSSDSCAIREVQPLLIYRGVRRVVTPEGVRSVALEESCRTVCTFTSPPRTSELCNVVLTHLNCTLGEICGLEIIPSRSHQQGVVTLWCESVASFRDVRRCFPFPSTIQLFVDTIPRKQQQYLSRPLRSNSAYPGTRNNNSALHRARPQSGPAGGSRRPPSSDNRGFAKSSASVRKLQEAVEIDAMVASDPSFPETPSETEMSDGAEKRICYTYLMQGLNETRTGFKSASKRIEFSSDDWWSIHRTLTGISSGKFWILAENRGLTELTEASFKDVMRSRGKENIKHKGQLRLPFDIGVEDPPEKQVPPDDDWPVSDASSSSMARQYKKPVNVLE